MPLIQHAPLSLLSCFSEKPSHFALALPTTCRANSHADSDFELLNSYLSSLKPDESILVHTM